MISSHLTRRVESPVCSRARSGRVKGFHTARPILKALLPATLHFPPSRRRNVDGKMKGIGPINYRRSLANYAFASLTISALCIIALAFGPPPVVTVDVTGQTSAPGSITPSHTGNVWTYGYTIANNSSLIDTIPVQICATTNASAEPDGYPLELKFGPQGMGGNLPGVTLPSNPTFVANGCQTLNISINTGTLAAGNYVKNVLVQKESADPSNTRVDLNDFVIHIKVRVNGGSVISCFITDSSGNFLTDCAGSDVTSGLGGVFSMVVNQRRNIVVATNPGQFYYDIVWTNTTGSDQTVKVDFSKTGVNGHGAQAIHGYAFPPPFSGVSPAQFNQVNDGVPSGNDDKLDSILVPDGWTLWANYHLEWSGVGASPAANIATSCATANQQFTVTGTVMSLGGNDVNEACVAGARGYRK